MDKQHAQIALQFLQRVTLQPAEIQAFQQCCGALQRVIQEADLPDPSSLAPVPDADEAA